MGTQDANSGVRRTPLSPEEVVQDRFSSDEIVWLASMQGQPSLPELTLDVELLEVMVCQSVCGGRIDAMMLESGG